MDAFDTANGQPQSPNMMQQTPGATAPGDAFDMAKSPPAPLDAFDSAASDWASLAHAHIANQESNGVPMADTQKLAVMQAYRQQYGGQALPAPNETLQQMAGKTAVDNTFLQNYGAAGAGALVHAGAGAVGLFNPAGGQAIRENALGAYGMAEPGSAGGELGGAVGGGLASIPTMFGGPAGLLLSAGEAAGNQRIDIADQRAAGANIGGGREALAALGAGAVDYGTNLLAQKLLGHVGGRITKAFGGEIAGALEAGDAGGAAQALVKMLTAEFGKEVVGNQAIAQIQNLANNAVAKITQPGTPLTKNATQAAVSALVQSVLLSPLSPLMHAAGAHGEPVNPTPELPADYSPLDIRTNVGPHPEPNRLYLNDDDTARLFGMDNAGNGEFAQTPPGSPAQDEAHPPIINSAADLGDYYGRTYNDAQNAATIQAMASMNPGRFVRARVPMDQIEPGILGEADKSQEKIDQLAAMSPEERQKLNPGILIQQRDGKFMPADGTHRFMGAAQAGDKVYRAYVPEAAIGKGGVEADTGNQPAESSPVEAPATTAGTPDSQIEASAAAPQLQPPGKASIGAKDILETSPSIQAAKAHFPDIEPVEPQTREQKEAVSVAKQLGVNAVFYTGGHEGRGFVLRDQPDSVYISAPSNRGVDAIRQAIGHELTRSLSRTNPEAFKEIMAAIPDADLSAAEKEYRAKLEAGGLDANGNATESAAALALGKAAMKERVWRAMSGKNPTAFEAFADRVSETFGKLTNSGRTLNKIVEAWNRVRPELQAKAKRPAEVPPSTSGEPTRTMSGEDAGDKYPWHPVGEPHSVKIMGKPGEPRAQEVGEVLAHWQGPATGDEKYRVKFADGKIEDIDEDRTRPASLGEGRSTKFKPGDRVKTSYGTPATVISAENHGPLRPGEKDHEVYHVQQDGGGVLSQAGSEVRRMKPLVEEQPAAKPAAKEEPLALGDTPVQRQFRQLKAKHPDYMLLFKMGDFYETFHEDAEKLAKITGVTLTQRRSPGVDPVKMAGVPFHAVEGYLRKIIATGQKVAIVEATGEGKTGIPTREVVRTAVPEEAPPKTAKEAKARRAAKAAPLPETATEKSGLPLLSSLKIEQPEKPAGGDIKLLNEQSRAKDAYSAAGKELSRYEANVDSAAAKKYIREKVQGLRGNERKRAANAAGAEWLNQQDAYRAAREDYFKKQVKYSEAQDAVEASKKQREEAHQAASEQAGEQFKETLRKYPWWEIQSHVGDYMKERNRIYTNRAPTDTPEIKAMQDVLGEKTADMQDVREPLPGEILPKGYEPRKGEASGKVTIGLPAGPKAKLPRSAAEQLALAGEVPATHTAEIDTEGFGGKATNGGAAAFKKFISTVPEFASNPKFTVTPDGRLAWNDQHGGNFVFNPNHLGVTFHGDFKPTPGETIGVDPAEVKKMKPGQVLRVYPPEGGAKPADGPAMLPTATAVANGIKRTGVSFVDQDVIPTVKSGVEAIKHAVKSAERFIAAGALDLSTADIKEHLKEAWSKNDLDRLRTEKLFEPAIEIAKKYSEPATTQMVEAVEAGQPSPDPKMQPFVDLIRHINGQLAGEAAAVGINTNKWTPDYVGRIFEFPDRQTGTGWTTSIAGAEHYLKGRVFDNYADALKFVKSVGGRNRYDNFIETQLAKWEEVRKGISMRREFKEAIGRGDIALFGARDKLPDGWKLLDDKLATLHAEPTWTTLPNGKRAETVNVAGRYAAPEAIANILNDSIAPGLYQKLPLWKRWAGLNHFITGINLGLSGAHMMNMVTGGAAVNVAQAADNLLHGEFSLAGKNAARAIASPIYNAWHGSTVRRAAEVAGSVPGMEPLVDAITAGGGRFGFDSVLDQSSWRKAKESFASGNPIGGTLHATNAAWRAISYPLFKMYIPNVKASLMAIAAETELSRAGSRDDLREKMGRWSDTIDNVLGEVVRENKFQHRIVQDAMQGLFLAPNWNEGLARLVGGSARDYVRAASDAYKGKSPTVTPAMLIPFGAVLAHMAASAAINRALSGQWPQSYKDYFQPRSGQKDNDGNDIRVNLLTPFKDIPSWLSAPGRTLWNKMSPLIHMAHDIAIDSDYHGVEIWHPGDSAGEKAKEVAKYIGRAALPFSVQSYQRMKDVGADKERELLGFAGLNPVPHYVANSPAEQLAQAIHLTQTPPGTRTQEQYDRHELAARLASSIRSNQPGARKTAIEAVRAGKITEEQYVQMLRDKDKTYLQRTVAKLPAEDAMRVYNVASDDERRPLVYSLMQKIDDSKTMSLEDKKHDIALLLKERTRLKK